MNRTASPRSARNASTSSVTVPSVGPVPAPVRVRGGGVQRDPDARVPAAQRGGRHRVVLEEEVLDRVLLLPRPALASAGGERVGPLGVRVGERLPRRRVEHRGSGHGHATRVGEADRLPPWSSSRRSSPSSPPCCTSSSSRTSRCCSSAPRCTRGSGRAPRTCPRSSRGPTTRASTTCSSRSARWSASSSRSPGRRRSVSRWSCWRAGRCSRPPSCSSRRTAPWPVPR